VRTRLERIQQTSAHLPTPDPHPSTDLLQERDEHIERLKTQLKETVDKGESFRNKLHAAIKKGKSIEAERNELRARLEQSPAGSVSGDAPGPGSDAPSTPTASTEELDALRKQLDDAKKAALSAEKKLAVMKAMSEADSKKNGEAGDELERLKERCDVAESNLTAARAQLEATAEELDSSRRLCESKAVAAEQLDDALKEVTAKLEESRKRELDATVGGARVSDAEARAANAEGTLASLRVEHAKLREMSDRRKDELEGARTELVELADVSDEELKVADETRAAAERERDKALERMRAAESAEAEADARVGAAEERADAAEAEAERLLEESEERGRRFAMVQTQFAKKEEELTEELESLRRSLGDDKKRSAGNLREVEGLKESLARAERAAEEANARADELELASLRATQAAGSSAVDVNSSASKDVNSARVGELELLVESLRRDLGDAKEETARFKRQADVPPTPPGLRGSDDESVLLKRVASAEALSKRLRATVESLEKDNKSLQWQISMSAGEVSPSLGPSSTPGKSPLRAGAGFMDSVGGSDGTLMSCLMSGRRRNLKRNLVFSYLALIHVVLFVEISRGCPSA
jgi:chromosome segregation ATPase